MKKTIYSFLITFLTLSVSGIAHAQLINTVAGNGTNGYNGDGIAATSAELTYTFGVAIDDTGNIFIADFLNHRVRKVSAATGLISTIAGTGAQGYNGDNIAATTAQLSEPTAIDFDVQGNIYILEYGGQRVRKIDVATGIITTVAGTGTAGYNGDGITATTAQLNSPYGICLDDTGNIYIADYYNARIRKVSAATGLISTIAGTGAAGYNGDGISAVTAELSQPADVDIDDTGNIYIADEVNNRIRKISAATGLISTLTGDGNMAYNGDGIPATSAEIWYPYGLKVDASGSVYIAEYGGQRLRKIDGGTGLISTIAGTGVGGYNGDGILATTAQLNSPLKVALDDTGNVYIADAFNNRIRKVAQPCSNVTAGTIHTAGLTVACDSVSDTLTLLGATSGAGIMYQWQSSTNGINWNNVGTNATTYLTGTLFTTTYFKAIVTCIGSGMSDSTVIDTITVNVPVAPSVAITVSPGANIGMGQTATFTAVVTNGGLAPTYQWQKNHVNIAGATANPYITNAINNNDTITCLVHGNATCMYPDTALSNKILMHVSVNVPQVNGAIAMSLFPNPNDGTFVIDGTLNNDKEAAIEITNVVGQVVYTATVTANKGRLHNSITLPANIGNGVYTIHIKSSTQSATQKIVISK